MTAVLLLAPLLAAARGAPAQAAPRKDPLGPAAAPSPRPSRDVPPFPGQPEAQRIGLRLIERYRAGSLRFVNTERDKAQMKQIAYRGYCVAPDGSPVPIAPAVLRTLDHLSARSTPRKPLVVLSLYRPPTALRARSAHGRGMAIDIAAYNGYAIDSRDPRRCVQGVLSVIKALEPRAYRLGLPKPPGTDPKGLLPPPPRPAKPWPFFPAPVPRVLDLLGYRAVAPLPGPGGTLLRDRRGYLRPDVLRWENERSAPLGHVGSPRVRRAVRDARRRGADIHLLFPDALDHLHLDVVPPARSR